MGKSSDHPGEAAVIRLRRREWHAAAPSTVDGVRTLVIPTNARAVSFGTAPLANAISSAPALNGTALNQALAIKRQVARGLMAKNPAFFGVGVGQSLDNPREAALVIYVDRTRIPGSLPQADQRAADPLRGDGSPACDAVLRDHGAVDAGTACPTSCRAMSLIQPGQ